MKVLSVFLAVLMVISCWPVTGFAFESDETDASGINEIVQTEDVATAHDIELAEVSEPVIYSDNNLVYIYANETAEYKIDNGEWQAYVNPFTTPAGSESVVYARLAEDQSNETSITVNNAIGQYAESNADMGITYFGTSFDIARTYDSSKATDGADDWFFSFESRVDVDASNAAVIKVVMPDGTMLSFEKESDNTYLSKAAGCKLTVDNGQYIVKDGNTVYTYDNVGVLSSVADYAGHAITFAKDSDNKIVSITAGTGHTYAVAYDENDNVSGITNPLGEIVKYEYNDGKLSKVYWDSSSFVITGEDIILGEYQYGTDGKLSKSSFKAVTYDTFGRVIRERNDDGSYVDYTYEAETYTYETDSEDDVEETVAVTTIKADFSNETSSVTKINDAQLVVASIDEDENTTEYKYNNRFQTEYEKTADTKTEYTYDEKGNVLTISTDSSKTIYTYTASGMPLTEYTVNTDEDEKETTSYTKYEYDDTDIVTTVTQSKNADYSDAVVNTYADGMLTRAVDKSDPEKPTGTNYFYDAYGNVLKTESAVVENEETKTGTVTYEYDALNRTVKTADEENTTTCIYNAAGNVISQTDGDGTQRTLFDKYARTVQSITAEDYDAEKDGLHAETPADTYSDKTVGHTYVYAANGSLTSETNRIGKTTKYYYNDRGSKVREEFDIYKFYYLNHGELYQVKVANVTTVSYSYGTKFQLLTEKYANDETIRYTYNDNGDVAAQYHNSNAKPYVTYTYNSDNELTEKINTDTGLKYVYGENGHVSIYKTADNTLVQTYTEEKTEADEETETKEYTTVTEKHFGKTYTSVVKDKSVSFTANNKTVEYGYTADDNDKITAETFANAGNSVISSAYTYDKEDNVTSKSYTYGSNKHLDYVNEYDDKGKITASGIGTVSQHYTYDKDDQLTAVEGEDYNASYVYDARGNLTSKTVNGETTSFTYANSGWKDRLISVDGTKLTYDKVGNVLTYGDKKYTWNSGRHLESITDGENTYSYTYDENGIRTSKTVNGVTTYYNTSDGVILSQTDGTNTMYFQYDSNGVPFGFIYNGSQYFYLTNQMGDVAAIANSNGFVIAQYNYDEWGRLLSIDASAANTIIANANPIRYRGYYYDNETGYYYLQSRYYDANICRFINSDIPEIAQRSEYDIEALNLYLYCSNNSINKKDTAGYWGSDVHFGFNKDAKNRFYKTYSISTGSFYYGTFYWANQKVGFSYYFAYNIAYWCNDVDKTYSPAKLKNNDWHFNSNWGKKGQMDSRVKHKNEMLNKAKKYLEQANKKKNKKIYYNDDLRLALKYIGYALHPIQDRYSHIYIKGNKYSSYSIGFGKYSHVGVAFVDNAKIRAVDVFDAGTETIKILKSLYNSYAILRIKNLYVSL